MTKDVLPGPAGTARSRLAPWPLLAAEPVPHARLGPDQARGPPQLWRSGRHRRADTAHPPHAPAPRPRSGAGAGNHPALAARTSAASRSHSRGVSFSGSPPSTRAVRRPRSTSSGAGLHDRVRRLRRAAAGAPQRGADAGQQFAQGEGLLDVVVRPGIQGGDLLGFLVAGGQHDDRRRVKPRSRGIASLPSPSGRPRSSSTSVRRTLGRSAGLRPCLARSGASRPPPAPGQEAVDLRLVIHDEDAGRCRPRSCRRGTSPSSACRAPPAASGSQPRSARPWHGPGRGRSPGQDRCRRDAIGAGRTEEGIEDPVQVLPRNARARRPPR